MYHRKPAQKSELESVIDYATAELKGLDASSEQYAACLEQLATLYAIKDNKNDRISKDTLLMVAGNLAGILVIVSYEQKHVVVTKALNFLGKFK